MRHRKKGRKLGTDASHTKAMKKSLVAALLANDRIKTTEPRAKEIRGDVDRVITWAKRGDVHSRRLAIAKVGDKEIVREVFDKVGQGMFADRPGGYTRIYKLGNRKGDNAPMVIIELVTEPVKAKKADKADAPATKGAVAERKAAAEANAKLKFDEAEEAVENAAEKVGEKTAEAGEAVEHAAAVTGEAIGNAAVDVKDAVEHAAADVKDVVEDAAIDVKDAVEHAAAKTGEAIKEAAAEVKAKIGEAVESAERSSDEAAKEITETEESVDVVAAAAGKAIEKEAAEAADAVEKVAEEGIAGQSAE